MEKYLRPETLFGIKFESYLNENSSNDDNSI
ncbi:conserved phage C-terminal domain-containing protein [Clostridium gasigenes]|nr:conserved phage C-terminal domain-containing protein [Clostridium gasigenes]